ncbi:hypothetical protein NQ314_015715 [Rhamnusium bicolor]|uniref:Uncharacterized protein n=1 Tax=Rhamnusium bicolor TaxID=1586634 RepID=A0AAV8WXS3_9CUCU|nr:hypothetical protein NQ314_015715 [Rhamnusium bicolor]
MTENIPVSSPSSEENACELNFVNTTKCLETGRFVVAISLKMFVESLGECFDQAKSRFISLERKLLKRSAT